ncbi:MAG: hypothetical protein ACYTKD_14900, partial [Planctomycetota bacterium]
MVIAVITSLNGNRAMAPPPPGELVLMECLIPGQRLIDLSRDLSFGVFSSIEESLSTSARPADRYMAGAICAIYPPWDEGVILVLQ